jgi:acetolactate synthase-1/2/3 large subunit
MSRRGADLVVDALVAAGVRRIFTLSGNHVLSLYDAVIGRDIALVHTRHEAAAVHMADGWGRVTDIMGGLDGPPTRSHAPRATRGAARPSDAVPASATPGVVLVTAGPGHANALGALYTALMAESPVVLLSGHAPRGEIGAGGFQEVEQVDMARPVTKAAWLCDEPDRLGMDVRRALALASAGRPGPVHLSLPGDVLEWKVSSYASAFAPSLDPPTAATADEIAAILGGLADASRPLILTGPAMARGARSRVVAELGALTGAPALPVESPRGVNDPWLRAATRVLGEADFVLLLGKALDFSLRFGGAPPFAPRCRFAQVVSGAPLPAKAGRIDIACSADPMVAAGQLLDAARRRSWTRSGWRDEVERARLAAPPDWADLRRSSQAPLHPLRVCAVLDRHVRDGAVLVCDGGEFGQWVQAALEPRERLINGLSGSIGSGLPMALGAKLACPDRPVIATLGDGTFGYHAMEVDTAVRYGIPVVAVVGNDARWNAEHQLQLRHYGAERTVGCELLPSRYDLVASALGAHGALVERADDLEPALERALASGRPAVVNVRIASVAAPTFP